MENSLSKNNSNRLLSLDFMRGLVMVLLTLETTELYPHIRECITDKESFGFKIISQFFHNQWVGLHFWDLIQPAFMFMAGVSMAYSLTSQTSNGVSWNQQLIKTLKRCGLLLFFGLFKRIHDPNWLSLEALDVTDILTQLAFTTLIAFLLFNLKSKFQILACLGILVLTELLYRYNPINGYNQAFVDGKNFGDYIDLILFGQHTHGYVFINWLPTAVHTIAGTIVGKMFIQNRNQLKYLLIVGIVSLVAGYGISAANITPIIKPIATSSFMLASLGFCMLALALCYWWIDIKLNRKGLLLFQVVGMNSIFVYLFCDTVGKHWLNEYVEIITLPIFKLTGLADNIIMVLISLSIFAVEWGVFYFLYKKKIFFKL